jgi:uncharacterized protein (DUF736 family)
MVIVGLVLGVVVAVIVAAQGCGENHPKRRTFHGGAPVAVSWSDAAASAARARA